MSIQTPKNRFLRLCTAEQSRSLDDATINDFGIDGIILMEIAGLKTSEIIRHHVEDHSHGLFLCGKGNNAGDAFVIARYLSDQPGHEITIYLAAGNEGFSPDAEKNLDLLKKLANKNRAINITMDLDSGLYHSVDYIVDGMIGTGLSSDVREPLLSCIKKANTSSATTFSLDTPTGLNCDTGQILGDCIRADHTITFGTNKIGFYMEDGPSICGKIHLAELPFPEHLRQNSVTLIAADLTDEFETYSNESTHKYKKGTVHIIAGSSGITGAAIMAAKSAWKAGAGAVILYVPKGLLSIYEQTLPEIIKIPVGDFDEVEYAPAHASAILEKISEKPGVVLIGPGIGRSKNTQNFTKKVLEKLNQPTILDADALFGWKSLDDIDKSNWTITPHIGELKNSVGLEFKTDAERLRAIQELSATEKCIVLSKGYPSMVATADKGSFITEYDTRIFAKAGFGDVLAGTIGGKMAVSNIRAESVLSAMIDIYYKINLSSSPEPRDIYGR